MADIYKTWAQLTKRLRWVIALFWGAVAVVGFFFAYKLLHATTGIYKSTVDTMAMKAYDKLEVHFPALASSDVELTLFQSKDPNVLLTEGPLSDTLEDLYHDYKRASKEKYGDVIKDVLSYFTVMRDLNPPLPILGKNFVNENGTATFFLLSHTLVSSASPSKSLEFAVFIKETIKDLLHKYGLEGQLTVSTVGSASLISDIATKTTEDMKRAELIVFPVAMLILCYVIGNVPFMIFPALSIPSVILASFSLVYAITKKMDVVSFAPSLMMSICMALGIDYCMFLLVRFQEAYREHRDLDSAVQLMLKSSGHVILVSGTTLICCFGGTMALPVDALKSSALANIITTVFSMLVSLTLVPALIFIWGEKLLQYHEAIRLFFVTYFSQLLPFWFPSKQQTVQAVLNDEEKGDREPISDRNDIMEDYTPYAQRGWLKFGKWILAPWNGVITLTVLGCLIIPFVLKTFEMQSYPDWSTDSPANSESYQTIKALGSSFHKQGLYMPNYILFVAKPGRWPDGILQPEPWNKMGAFIETVTPDLGGSTLDEYEGPLVMGGQPIPYSQVSAATDQNSASSPDLTALRFYLGSQSTASKDALYMTMTAKITPYSKEGFEWTRNFRSFVESSPISQDFDVYLVGLGPSFSDLIYELYQALPFVMAGTLAVVFVVLGLMYRSILAPIRSLISMCYTLFFVYGLGVMVYQDGILSKLGFFGLQPMGKITWMALASTFSIILGFSLDYDVFLCSRCLEYRLDGYDHRSAILKGYVSTGRIITFAGIIMSIAFSGLMFSSFPTLCQFAFFLISALLVDTFVVRTMITPIMLNLCGESAIWWPRKDVLEPPTKAYPSPADDKDLMLN